MKPNKFGAFQRRPRARELLWEMIIVPFIRWFVDTLLHLRYDVFFFFYRTQEETPYSLLALKQRIRAHHTVGRGPAVGYCVDNCNGIRDVVFPINNKHEDQG